MQRKIIPDVIHQNEIYRFIEGISVIEAARQMREWNVAAVCVTDDGGRLLGIVTERDMTRRVVAENLDPTGSTVGQVMTRRPDTLAPDDTAGDALQLMSLRGVRHLPVVDDHGTVVGMVSLRDLYAVVTSELEHDMRETEAFVFGDRYGT